MSNFNIQWLKENLQANATIFYIGAAGLTETISFRQHFSDATIHAFECSTYWVEKHPILNMAKQHNIQYHQLAVSDVDGEVSFYQSEKNNDETWPVSSSIFEPTENIEFLSFSIPVTVNSTRLDTFCEKHGVHPDFIHIDAQGAEHAIFSAIGKYKPKIIWTEISEFHNYETGVTYQNFYDLMIELGYKKLVQDGPDELYVLANYSVTEYVSNSIEPSFVKTLSEKTNIVNFVYKSKDHASPYNIHVPENTFFYNTLKQLDKVSKVYYADALPNKKFIYEYQQSHEIETTVFFGENGFNEIDSIPHNVVSRIREKTAFLLITIPFESPLQPNRLSKIHEYFKKLNFPASQVIYLTGCLNANELYKDYCTSINDSPACIMEYNFSENLVIHSQFAEKMKNYQYSATPKKKTFLMFNRRWLHHPHRTLFLYNINKRKMLEDFYISFSKKDVDHQEHSYSEILKGHYEHYFTFENQNPIDVSLLTEIDSMLPIYLDTPDLYTSSLMFDEFDSTCRFYDESFINIIAETYFYTSTADILHLTEKTFKPMLYKQPFIMLGAPGMLKKLRELGFKTFHDVWDESYDDTPDHTERFYKILDLCKKISEWPQLRKVLAMQKCKSIVEHNFNLLLNYNSNPTLLLDFIKRHKLSPYDE
jgi:FkbM family methyltransferase